MRNKSFRFKQFEVFHDKCAMKIGTDGVLLGAWARVDNCKTILDVGAGTGLISLMIAQRNSVTDIMAIEIDEIASIQASENIVRSPFENRVEVKHISFQDFADTASIKFDAIVSNPPYFINSMLPDNMSRSNARHTNSLSLTDLLSLSSGLLAKDGRLSFIYPYDEISDIERFIVDSNWYVYRRMDVFSTPSAEVPKRVLFEVGLNMPSEGVAEYDTMVIEIDRHVYSDKYVELTKEFYLNM